MTKPEHKDGDELKKFDFIVSNPPFKMDFSNMIENLKTDKYNRFFAGLPNIPKKDKNGMAVYETFTACYYFSFRERKSSCCCSNWFCYSCFRYSKRLGKNWLMRTSYRV